MEGFCEKNDRMLSNCAKDWSDLRRRYTETKQSVPAMLDLRCNKGTGVREG